MQSLELAIVTYTYTLCTICCSHPEAICWHNILELSLNLVPYDVSEGALIDCCQTAVQHC